MSLLTIRRGRFASSVVLLALAAQALFSASGCSQPPRGAKIDKVDLVEFLISMRFEGLELTAPQTDSLKDYTAPGNHVSLWFYSKGPDKGTFSMALGKDTLKGDWVLGRDGVTMNVRPPEDKKQPADALPKMFEFRAPRFVDDAFVIYSGGQFSKSTPCMALLVRNVGLEKYWQMKDGETVKPSRTLIFMP